MCNINDIIIINTKLLLVNIFFFNFQLKNTIKRRWGFIFIPAFICIRQSEQSGICNPIKNCFKLQMLLNCWGKQFSFKKKQQHNTGSSLDSTSYPSTTKFNNSSSTLPVSLVIKSSESQGTWKPTRRHSGQEVESHSKTLDSFFTPSKHLNNLSSRQNKRPLLNKECPSMKNSVKKEKKEIVAPRYCVRRVDRSFPLIPVFLLSLRRPLSIQQKMSQLTAHLRASNNQHVFAF